MNKIYAVLLTVIVIINAGILVAILHKPTLENQTITVITSPTPIPSPSPTSSLPDTIGFMGSAEQVSVTNLAFPDANTIQAMVQNAGGNDSIITTAFLNGQSISSFQSVTVPKDSSITISINAPLASGTAYTVKLITSYGTTIVSSPTTYSP